MECSNKNVNKRNERRIITETKNEKASLKLEFSGLEVDDNIVAWERKNDFELFQRPKQPKSLLFDVFH